ncbi:MAG: metallophosphatase family protein [Peptococcaceae bacterium]|nr:metallophosphatase family protein [Peptococcaceae bacterium]
MRIAVISDIHANIAALEAVLKDIEGRAADALICTGDLVGYAPFPNEVIGLIRERQIACVMGNYDDAIGNYRLICGCDYRDAAAQELGERSIAWTRERVTEENKEFLRNLPAGICLQAGGLNVRFVHGSPRRLNEYLHEDVGDGYLKELLAEARADVLVCGHTHVPYHKRLGAGRHVVNAGSVGKPKHGDPLAVYAVLDLGGEVKVEFRKVQYDYESTARAIEASGLPEEFAGALRTGRG